MSFVSELKRRKVFQVAAVYLVVAWLIMQVVDVVNEPLRLPEWFATVAILIVAIGFPIALILSWAFDLTPEGVVKDQGSTAPTRSDGRRIEYVFIGLLIVAVGWLSYREVGPTRPVDQGDVLPNSVAVLPFTNLSADPEDAFFAAGIHDTILHELAKITDMNVIARTSVLPYGDGQTPIAQIAEELNVETIMEGTVQYAEGQVRITVQLINPETGSHIWSGNYDRAFADIFVIQSEIASRIAVALEAELSPAEQESIARRPTDSAAAYALYLNASDAESRAAALSYLDRAIAIDPGFALAYATKARIIGSGYVREVAEAAQRAPETAADVAEELERLVLSTAEQALGLNPDLGLAYSALGLMHMRRWRRQESEDAFSRALALSPNDPEVLTSSSLFHSLTGQHDDAIYLAQRAIQIDPANSSDNLALAHFFAGEYEAAAFLLRQLIADNPTTALYFRLAEVETASGDYSAALEHVQIRDQAGDWGVPGGIVRSAYVYSIIGRQEDAVRVVALLQDLAPSLVQQATEQLVIGDATESLRLLQEAVATPLPLPGNTLSMILKHNIYADPILDQPEFVEVRSRLGFRE